jgi:hypothetical protein
LLRRQFQSFCSSELGTLALIAGLDSLFDVKLPFFAILFILIGASIIFQPLIEKKQG